MEIGLREWLVIGGIILIGLIILDGWRRMNGNRNRLRMDIDPAAADLPEEPVRSSNPELPNGGARLVGEDPLFSDMEPNQGLDAIDPISSQSVSSDAADILFDHHKPGVQERIEPGFGDEPNLDSARHSQPVDAGLTEENLVNAPMSDNRPSHVDPQKNRFYDNDDCDELLGPARVVTLNSDIADDAQSAVSEDEERTAVHSKPVALPDEVSPVVEMEIPVVASTHSAPSVQPAEPLFPTLDGFDDESVSEPRKRVPDAVPEFVAEIQAEPEPQMNVPQESEPTRSAYDPENEVRESEFEAFSTPIAGIKGASDIEKSPVSESHKEEPCFSEVSKDDDLDLDKPITLLLDDDKYDEQEVLPSLFADEAIAPEPDLQRKPSNSVVAPAADKPKKAEPQVEIEPDPVPETEDLFAERPALDKTPDPESVLAITVLAGESLPISGATLLPLVNACGMRFGEMKIFHRFEDGIDTGAVQFSMASAINPGTFDLDEMDQMTTRGLTFFMSMEEPRDVMNAFECMLATAETVAKHMGAELLDENRSVLRPQTKEHYRQRIRDFGMRNLSRRVH
ncbi:cell division protein ZipA [Pontibacterium sp. N1Y112]|uniref:Cell division protein ZipA n=1 Tax=Pontibacterium sinense TaxID=2781979 RepID=A0A8J7JXK0_9GAMM|nr:cell division protein ZipA [Pontibacterium sinense]MBE9396423.1 cell division protein ZipA [Pontibacterium sinense]